MFGSGAGEEKEGGFHVRLSIAGRLSLNSGRSISVVLDVKTECSRAQSSSQLCPQ